MKSSFRLHQALAFGLSVSTLNHVSLAVAGPPDPFTGNRFLLTTKFNINRPVTDTEQKFRAVRELMNVVDLETAGVAEHHPEKNVTCDQCHATDSVSVDHYGLVINEANPEKSCSKAGCHDLTVAGEMPFYVKPFASLDATSKSALIKQRLNNAKNLLQYANSFASNLSARMADLPAFSNFSIDIKAEDKLLNNLTHDTPLTFFEAQNSSTVKSDADMLPFYAVTGLTTELFALSAPDLSLPTRLTGTVEARVKRAGELAPYLGVADRDSEIAGLLTNKQLVLRYLATLPTDSIEFVTAELAEHFPTAVAKADTSTSPDNLTGNGIRRTKTWEIPALDNAGTAATISLQLNSPGARTQPSSQLIFQRLTAAAQPAAITVLENLQQHYPAIQADQARYTLTYQAHTATDKTLLTDTFARADHAALHGDLRRNLSHSENTTTGTLPESGQIAAATAAIQRSAQANPAGLRRLRSTIRYKADLSARSQVNNEVLLAELPIVTITAKRPQISESGTEKIVFNLSRRVASDQPLTVYYSTAGTARAGKDYKKPKSSVVIPKGQSSLDISVAPINDRATETDETVIIKLAAKQSYSVDSIAGNASVTIVDDDLSSR